MYNIHFAYHIEKAEFTFLDNFILQMSGGERSLTVLLNLIHPQDLVLLERAYDLFLKRSFEGSVRFRVGDDVASRWLHLTPFYDEEKNMLYGCLVDISDEVNNLDSISRYANKKNSILHMLAHDLRGPLDIARSLANLMDANAGDKAARDRASAISAIIKQSIELINDLTDREFLETVGAALVKKRVDIVQKLAEYLDECRRSSYLAERTFVLESSHDSIMIEVDEAKLMQVFNNLITNALKFTREGGEIVVSLIQYQENIRIVFTDNGIGIPKALLPEIFEKFTSARRPGLNGEPTIGLGLSIVRTIINWHDGHIWCESEEGKGTSIFIELPKLATNSIDKS